MDNINEKIGEKLKTLRNNQGMSQEELGYRLQVTKQSISNFEKGKREMTFVAGLGEESFAFCAEKTKDNQ